MVRLQWHVEDGCGATVAPGGLSYHKDTGVVQAMIEMEFGALAGGLYSTRADACMTLPPNYTSEAGVRQVGVVIAHGNDMSEWRSKLLTDLSVTLAKAGYAVMRCICNGKDTRRQRIFEKSLDVAATSPYARSVKRWVLAGVGSGARVAALAAGRTRANVAGYAFLSYPLLEALPSTSKLVSSSADSSQPLLRLTAPMLFVCGGLDPLVNGNALKALCPRLQSWDVRALVVPDVDEAFRTAAGKGPLVGATRQLGSAVLEFLQALLLGQMSSCKLPCLWRSTPSQRTTGGATAAAGSGPEGNGQQAGARANASRGGPDASPTARGQSQPQAQQQQAFLQQQQQALLQQLQQQARMAPLAQQQQTAAQQGSHQPGINVGFGGNNGVAVNLTGAGPVLLSAMMARAAAAATVPAGGQQHQQQQQQAAAARMDQSPSRATASPRHTAPAAPGAAAAAGGGGGLGPRVLDLTRAGGAAQHQLPAPASSSQRRPASGSQLAGSAAGGPSSSDEGGGGSLYGNQPPHKVRRTDGATAVLGSGLGAAARGQGAQLGGGGAAVAQGLSSLSTQNPGVAQQLAALLRGAQSHSNMSNLSAQLQQLGQLSQLSQLGQQASAAAAGIGQGKAAEAGGGGAAAGALANALGLGNLLPMLAAGGQLDGLKQRLAQATQQQQQQHGAASVSLQAQVQQLLQHQQQVQAQAQAQATVAALAALQQHRVAQQQQQQQQQLQLHQQRRQQQQQQQRQVAPQLNLTLNLNQRSQQQQQQVLMRRAAAAQAAAAQADAYDDDNDDDDDGASDAEDGEGDTRMRG